MATEGKKLVKSHSGYRMVPVDDTMTSPFTLQEPRWIPDNQCQSCVQCQGKFDFFTRRHHCRRCGKCFCDKCCSNIVPLVRMLFVDPVRQCAGCSNISNKETEFFEKHMKTLMAGGQFEVHFSGEDEQSSCYTCKLSTDHRYLRFENDGEKLDDVMLSDIDSVQIWTEETDPDGNPIASGVAINYKNSCGEQQIIKMVIPDGQNRRKGQAWVASLQKAFKMVYNARNLVR